MKTNFTYYSVSKYSLVPLIITSFGIRSTGVMEEKNTNK